MGTGPYSRRGLLKTSRLQRRQECLWRAETCLKQTPKDEKGPILEPGRILQVHRPQEFGKGAC